MSGPVRTAAGYFSRSARPAPAAAWEHLRRRRLGLEDRSEPALETRSKVKTFIEAITGTRRIVPASDAEAERQTKPEATSKTPAWAVGMYEHPDAPGPKLGTLTFADAEDRLRRLEAWKPWDRERQQERLQKGYVPSRFAEHDASRGTSWQPNAYALGPIVDEARARLVAGATAPTGWRAFGRRTKAPSDPVTPPPGFDWLPLDELVDICRMAWDHALERRGADRDTFILPARAISRSVLDIVRLSVAPQYDVIDLGRCVAWDAPYLPPMSRHPGNLNVVDVAVSIVRDLAHWMVDGEGYTWLWGTDWPERATESHEVPKLDERTIDRMYQAAMQFESTQAQRGLVGRQYARSLWIERCRSGAITGMRPAEHPERWIQWDYAIEPAWDLRERLRAELAAIVTGVPA